MTLPISIEVDICSSGSLSCSFCSPPFLTVPFLLPIPPSLVIAARLTAPDYNSISFVHSEFDLGSLTLSTFKSSISKTIPNMHKGWSSNLCINLHPTVPERNPEMGLWLLPLNSTSCQLITEKPFKVVLNYIYS